jgi:hypothetical protein
MMKKITLVVALLGVVALMGQVYAGSCCPASKKSGDQASMKCSSALSGIELSAEQKAKIAAIEEACKAEGSTKEACSKSMSQIRDVLTDSQRLAFDAACGKMDKKSGCGG